MKPHASRKVFFCTISRRTGIFTVEFGVHFQSVHKPIEDPWCAWKNLLRHDVSMAIAAGITRWALRDSLVALCSNFPKARRCNAIRGTVSCSYREKIQKAGP